MQRFNRLGFVFGAIALAGAMLAPLPARTRKGDKLLVEGRDKDARKDYDAALELYEQALSQDPSDAYYQLSVERARFEASQAHVNAGLKIRAQGNLTQALIELQKGYQIDPSSNIAEMEIRRTQEMIAREKKKAQQPGMTPEQQEESKAEAGFTPAQLAKKAESEKLARILPVPELRPLKAEPINLVLRNQPPKVLFETVGKVAGINVLFDQDFIQQNTKALSIDITNSTLEQALDDLSVLTKGFWKPLSANTIFVTQDNTTKRRDYEEQVMKVFYLNNVTTPQEANEIITTLRSVADLQRIFAYSALNAIVVRGEADRVELAEKIISDLDKPKAEVVVDVIVMQATRSRSRDLAFNAINGGLKVPIVWTPGGVTPSSSSSSTNSGNTGNIGSTGGTSSTPTSTTSSIPLSRLNRISSKDYQVTVPSGLLEALMSDSSTRILQSPQVRAVDAMKANLKIGQKVPTASGSFQPGVGGVGINPLVNTQFQYIDVGVIVDMTPHIHENGELDLHVEVEISSVDSHVNLGGIDQPVIGSRKVTHDIRLKAGEVNLLGGLMQVQETKTKSGTPGLASIPLLGRLFTQESIEKDTSELLIALVPHIVRKPEITAENLKPVAVGSQTVVSLRHAPRPELLQPAPQGGQPAAATPTAPTVKAPEPAAPPVTPAPGTPLATPAAPAPTTPPPATVVFSPAQAQIGVNGTVSINFTVNNAIDFFSVPLTFTFDPKVVRLSDVVRGGFASADGISSAFTKNIQNDTGTATVSVSRMFGQQGVNGSGVLLTLVFQGIAPGSSTVTLPQLDLRDSKGQIIPRQPEAPPQAAITVR
jgi:general secretion pathway protein D